jgi:hypothetical protein
MNLFLTISNDCSVLAQILLYFGQYIHSRPDSCSLITALVIGARLQIFKTDKNLLPILIAATALDLLVFLFSVFVSCSQKSHGRIALSIIFIVFAFTLLTCCIVAIVRESDVVPGLEKLWTGTSQTDKTLLKQLKTRSVAVDGMRLIRDGEVLA